MFQKVEIAPEIGSDPRLQAAVEHATRVLERSVGHSSGLVGVRWDKSVDAQGRSLLRMRLSDWTGQVEGFIASRDLDFDDQLRDRFFKLYGDLLQIRSHKQLDELLGGAVTVGPSP